MLYPESLLQKLGFEEIKTKLKQECYSTMASDMVDKMQFISNFELLQKILIQANEFKQLLQSGDYFPADHFIDLKSMLARVKVEGSYLQEENFHQIVLSLNTVFSCIDFFKIRTGIYPELEKLVANVPIDRNIVKSIEQIIDNKGNVRPNASKELAEISQEISYIESEARKRINSVFKELQKDGYTADTQLTIRDGRLAIPLLAEYKRKLKGVILDESSTGQTVFMEPVEVFEMNNKLRDLHYAKRREIIKILITLTNELRPAMPVLLSYHQLLTLVDFIRAKAKLANRMEANMPILKPDAIVNMIDGRHPLLFLSFKEIGKKVVPLTAQISESNHILLISGPNAGGKSVALKTIGLIQLMLQFGLLIPVAAHSEMGLMKNIFVDIGDDQSLENDLSTYSAHLFHMNYFVQQANSKTLVLIDEFGTGTDPKFGGPIAEAVLEVLNRKKVRGVITTHYSNLKNFANSTDGIQNASMLFDQVEMMPFYQLEMGLPGSSYAFEIAQKIGLPQALLNSAKQKIGHQQKKVDALLADLEREKKEMALKQNEIAIQTRKLNQLVQENQKSKEFFDANKKKILKEAKQEVDQLIKSANKLVENTIADIKSVKADKIATQTIRKKFEESSKDILKQTEPVVVKSNEIISNKAIKVGDWVVYGEDQMVAEVLSIQKNKAELAIGDLHTWIALSKLQLTTNRSKKVINQSAFSKVISTTASHFQPQIDIRGARGEEALWEVEKFLDKAIMLNYSEIRILHGKGDGILRKLIREFLKKYDVVSDVQSEHVEFGGDGITIVNLR